MPLAIAREQFSRGIQVRVFADARENIQHLPTVRFGVKHAVGRQQRQAMRRRQTEETLDDLIFPAHVMALQLDEQIARAKNIFELLQARFSFAVCLPLQRAHERPFVIAGQRHQTARELRQFIPAHFAFPFGRAQVSPRQHPAKVLVSRARFDQHRQHAAVFHRQFAADNAANPRFLRRGKKSRRTVNAIAVAQRHRRHLELRGDIRQLFRQGCCAQKTEGAAAVEFDVAHQS